MADAYVTLVAVQPTVAVRSGARQQQARKPQASLGASGGVFETLRNRQILRGQRGAGATGEVVVNRAPTPPRDVVFTSPAPRELHLAVRLADGSDDIVLYRSTTPVFNRATWARQVIPGYTGNSALLVPDPPPPGTYYYAVATQNEHGESPISGIAKAVIHDFPLRAPRCPLTRQAGLLGAQAWWEEVEGATGYAVYAAGVPNAPLTASVRIVVPRPPYMVLRTGTNYIRIAAIGPEGEGLLTPEQQFRITALTPTGFGASVVAEGIRLSWAIPATTNAVQQYFVYRALTPDGPFEIIATPATNTYTDQTADFDLPYFYKVSAVDTVDGEGIATSAVNITRVPVPVSSPLAHVYPRRVDGAYADGEPYIERAFTLAAGGAVEVDYFTQGYNNWDGIRVSVDGVSQFTNWTNVGAFGTTRVNLTAGTRTVRVAHARRAGAASGLDMTVVKAVRVYEGTTLIYSHDFTRGTVGAVLPAGWNTGAGNLAWQFYAPPVVPTPANVTATLYEDSIDVSWAAATPPSGFHEGYTIWRAQANEPWVKVKTVPNGTLTWRDALVPVGTTYFYAVSLNDGVYGAGPQSSAVLYAAHVAGSEVFAPYALVAANTPSTGIVLTWRAPATPNPPVATYSIYRATAADGEFALVGTTADLTYTDAAVVEGTTYYYRVTATDSMTGEGPHASAGPVQRVVTFADADTLALFRFDSTLTDEKGAYDLAYQGTGTTFSPGKHYSAVKVTSAGRVRRVTDAAFKAALGGDCTVEGWFKSETNDPNLSFPVSIMTDGGAAITSRWLCVMRNNTEVVVLTHDGADTQISSGNVGTIIGNWTHFAVRRKANGDGTFTMDLFVNGVFRNTRSASALSLSGNGTITVGGDGTTSGTGNKFYGAVDSLRISKKYRTDAEIAEFYAATPDVLGDPDALSQPILDADAAHLWEFETPDTIVDTGVAATPLNAVTTNPLVVPGLRGNALSMGGTARVIDNATERAPLFAMLGEDWTLEGWFYYSSAGTQEYPTIFGISNLNAWNYRAFLLYAQKSGNKIVWDSRRHNAWVSTDGNVTLGTLAEITDRWAPFAIRHFRVTPGNDTSFTTEFWLNGVMRAAMTGRGKITDYDPTGIVRLHLAGDSTGAVVDSYRLSNKKRSDAEIAEFIRRTKG